jgi:hypothetical protein
MFPLLPALILLLLQGHGPLERGPLPATLDALPWGAMVRQIEADKQLGRPLSAEARALLWLMAQPKETPGPSVEALPVAQLPLPEQTPARVAQGYAKSDRTRDGP